MPREKRVKRHMRKTHATGGCGKRITEAGKMLAEGEEKRRKELVALYRLDPNTSWKTILCVQTELDRLVLVEKLNLPEDTTFPEAIRVFSEYRHAKRAARVGLPPTASWFDIARREPDWLKSIRLCS